jgi:hypothetical protein
MTRAITKDGAKLNVAALSPEMCVRRISEVTRRQFSFRNGVKVFAKRLNIGSVNTAKDYLYGARTMPQRTMWDVAIRDQVVRDSIRQLLDEIEDRLPDIE